MLYYWKLFFRTFSLHLFKGRKIEFGIWCRYKVDDPISQQNLPQGKIGTAEYDVEHAHRDCHDHHFIHPHLLDSDSPSIRLFGLMPGRQDDPLCGELVVVSLDEEPIYEAVSYAWGSSEIVVPVIVNGQRYNVTPSLESFLRCYRSENQTRYLWLDQVCINQNDYLERNQQVQLMLKIYSQAANVPIWFGELGSHSQQGMQILDKLLNDDAHATSEILSLLPPDIIQNGIKDLLQREWWKRFWVVQEAVMARRATFICGQYRLSWETADQSKIHGMLQVIKWAVLNPLWEQTGLTNSVLDPLIDLLERQLQRSINCGGTSVIVKSPTFIDLMYYLRDKQATDARDRLYALVGLAESMHIPRLPDINYTLSLADVYELVCPPRSSAHSPKTLNLPH